ncbi:MAG: hypothetical protein OHK0046_04300 [Anaerolineae bacterium]
MVNLEDTKPKRPTMDDTQPKRPANFPPPPMMDDGVAAPPRILLWGVILLFVLGVVGSIAGIVLFREGLTPGQQVRVIGYLPFMEAFLPPHPDADDTLAPAATADPNAAQSLLQGPLLLASSTPAEVVAPTDAASPEATQESTPTPQHTPTTQNTPTLTPELTVTPTLLEPTLEPTAEPTVQAIAPTQDNAAAVQVIANTWRPSVRNFGFRRIKQGWNDCGPANISMALSYYGWTRDADYAASYLKPNDEDKNVSPWELVNFVEEQTDVEALYRVGGDLDLLRTLISNEFPVIIERSHMFEGYEWLGHYQTLAGYDDSQRVFYVYDSFLESTTPDDEIVLERYDELDRAWQDFNRTFIVVYDPTRENQLMNLLGTRATTESAAEHALVVAQTEARANPQDAFAWLNLGTSLTLLERYREASNAFDQAIELGLPWRVLWYQFAPYEALYNDGRYNEILFYVESNLENGGEYVEETYYWQGRALAALGETQAAATAFRTALNRNRLYTAARDALDQLNS